MNPWYGVTIFALRRVCEPRYRSHHCPPPTRSFRAPARSECLATSGHPGAPSQSVPNLTVARQENACENSACTPPTPGGYQSSTNVRGVFFVETSGCLSVERDGIVSTLTGIKAAKPPNQHLPGIHLLVLNPHLVAHLSVI